MLNTHANVTRSVQQPLSRRELLRNTGCGFGAVALAGLCAEQQTQASPLAERPTMFAPRAKRVIFIFMQGGPSHVDTFDYKPELIRRDGTHIDFVGVRFGDFGKQSKQKLMKPLWPFRQYGESGKWVSDLFPHIGQQSDDLCFLHGMHTDGVAHGPATLFLHTGATSFIRPSVGSWITYGLGTENQSLPGFITLGPSAANGGPRNYSNAFLPAAYQGTAVGMAGQATKKTNFRFLENPRWDQSRQRSQFDYFQAVNQQQLDAMGHDDDLRATIESYELAFRMQAAAPALIDTSNETEATLKLYGIDEKETEDFGWKCLLARRFAEAGVRYIQVNYSDNGTNPKWDQHSDMPKHAVHAKATDKPVAGLLADLKQRGLLDDTLVWWSGEFGRTPFTQGSNGRDHNPRGFTSFLAGGGVRRGFQYGTTDEIGHLAEAGRIHMHDLHATILHLLGIDHEQLTYKLAGREFRLTDVHGRVVEDIIA
ncbi:MAG: DUF1501 domain-containing protein [Pirellulaceae bacterium]|nr:DUF1501 domain-containing protein [Planctomycetales bacterium]